MPTHFGASDLFCHQKSIGARALGALRKKQLTPRSELFIDARLEGLKHWFPLRLPRVDERRCAGSGRRHSRIFALPAGGLPAIQSWRALSTARATFWSVPSQTFQGVDGTKTSFTNWSWANCPSGTAGTPTYYVCLGSGDFNPNLSTRWSTPRRIRWCSALDLLHSEISLFPSLLHNRSWRRYQSDRWNHLQGHHPGSVAIRRVHPRFDLLRLQ